MKSHVTRFEHINIPHLFKAHGQIWARYDRRAAGKQQDATACSFDLDPADVYVEALDGAEVNALLLTALKHGLTAEDLIRWQAGLEHLHAQLKFGGEPDPAALIATLEQTCPALAHKTAADSPLPPVAAPEQAHLLDAAQILYGAVMDVWSDHAEWPDERLHGRHSMKDALQELRAQADACPPQSQAATLIHALVASLEPPAYSNVCGQFDALKRLMNEQAVALLKTLDKEAP